jgi:hypothetical protein
MLDCLLIVLLIIIIVVVLMKRRDHREGYNDARFAEIALME